VEITILDDRPNPLLKRREYRFEVAHATAATPTRDAVRGELSKLVKAPKDRVIIERMAAQFGTATTRGDAMVYETADAAKSITREHILVRNGLKEKAAKGAAPPAEAAPPAKPESAPAAPKSEPTVPEAPKEAAPPEKPEHRPEPKEKGEPKTAPKDDVKGEHPKGERKPKTPKAEKPAPAEGGA
jgi:small subunit ribosomal protein S24e